MTVSQVAGLVAAVTRHYPLISGTANIANGKTLKLLCGAERTDVWAPVGTGRMLVPMDDFVGRSIYFFGDLDPKVSALARQCLEPGACALDIGANLGVVSLIMAQCVGPRGVVHAFEPSPPMTRYLHETLAANPLLPIRLHEYAIGAEEATLDLAIPQRNAGNATLRGARWASETIVPVPVKRLTEVVAGLGIGKIDFVKIDVEGFESEVLRGGREVLETLKPAFLVIEEHGLHVSDEMPETFRILFDCGYRIFGIMKSYFTPVLVELKPEKPVIAWDYIAVQPGGMAKVASFLAD